MTGKVLDASTLKEHERRMAQFAAEGKPFSALRYMDEFKLQYDVTPEILDTLLSGPMHEIAARLSQMSVQMVDEFAFAVLDAVANDQMETAVSHLKRAVLRDPDFLFAHLKIKRIFIGEVFLLLLSAEKIGSAERYMAVFDLDTRLEAWKLHLQKRINQFKSGQTTGGRYSARFRRIHDADECIGSGQFLLGRLLFHEALALEYDEFISEDASATKGLIVSLLMENDLIGAAKELGAAQIRYPQEDWKKIELNLRCMRDDQSTKTHR